VLVLLVYCMFNVVAMEFQLFVYLLVASFLCRSERFGAFHNLQYGTSTTIVTVPLKPGKLHPSSQLQQNIK
jgi:hypothetical protein